ncbi:MAG: hypothetical protein AMJ65_07450 [Phycisphaerae bacterium SG8_4]|nr:MAG: hypothetical protein AMJ65_07450 [Phycisphaerae bacterium SG8_4]
MKCPKCGNENPDNVWICGSCRHVLRDNVCVNAKTSKLAIISLALGILSVLLFVLAGIPAIVVGIISIVRIGRSGGMLRGKRIATAGVVTSVVLMGAFFLLWSLDAPPIPNDYTLTDIHSAPPECAESFEILKTLVKEELDHPGAPAIGLTQQDVDMSGEIRAVIEEGAAAEISEILGDYSKDIERVWANMEQARYAIGRLDAFAEIADLTELTAHYKVMRMSNLLELARFYKVYAFLKIEQRNVEVLTADLIELDSVLRKLSVNARTLFAKLICLLAMKENIETVNAIVNDAGTVIKTVELLSEHFVPFTDEHMSLRSSVLSEYLFLKSSISKAMGSNAIAKTPLFKRNSTLRLHRNHLEDWLNTQCHLGNARSDRLSVWPDIYPFDEHDPLQEHSLLSFIYRCYNPLGSRAMGTAGFFRGADPARTTHTLVKDDLLQIVLKKRLGKEVSMKARAYGEEYIVDIDNRKILSPGPDGKTDTKDDIALPINPEVLGWRDSKQRLR